MSVNNPLGLYVPVVGKDLPPRAKHAQHEQDFTQASYEAHALVQNFYMQWRIWQTKWMHVGAADTVSAEAFCRLIKTQFGMAEPENLAAKFKEMVKAKPPEPSTVDKLKEVIKARAADEAEPKEEVHGNDGP